MCRVCATSERSTLAHSSGVNRGRPSTSGSTHSHVRIRSADSSDSSQWTPTPIGFCSIQPASCAATSSA